MTSPSSSDTIDRDNTIPMYQQIRQELENQMLSGKLPLGAQVPTELSLCELHGVSRITARRALEELRKMGLVERTPGRGSFVRALPEGKAEGATEIAVLTPFTAHRLQASSDLGWDLQIVRGLDCSLYEAGYHASSVPLYDGVNESLERFWERIDALEPRLAGVLAFASPCFPSAILDELDRRALPWVTVNRISRQQAHNFVAVDNFDGNRRMADEILRQGYQRAFFVSTSLQHMVNSDRFLGFIQGWLNGGRSLKDISHMEAAGSNELNAAEIEHLTKVLTGNDRPDVIFCGGDLLASATLKTCQQLGLSVPNNVAVVGGTGLMLAEHTSPTLTVLAQPMFEIGHAAESMLVEMIRTKQQRVPGRYIPCPLIRRDSCPIGIPPV